jgi:phosphoglycolate phosphatase-like HAD superfamily hydrolase
LTPTIVVDLDGPILDTRRRHHACYARILGDGGCETLDLRTYWSLKRRPIAVGELLARSGCVAIPTEDFERRWLRLIEQPRFLALDIIQQGALEKLRHWNQLGFHLILASMRRDSQTAGQQLRELGISELFATITFSSPARGPEGKAASVISVMPPDSRVKVWIGDTEADVAAARIAGFQSIAVSCGIRSRAFLTTTKPDLLVPRLAAIRGNQLDSLSSSRAAPATSPLI